MKLTIKSLLIAMAISTAAMAQQPLTPACGTPRKNVPQMTVDIDSVDFRDDLTRVYCRAIGRPHTAQRIDAAEIHSTGVKAAATDIDGVDFKRYFQWEESGIVPLDIDFPPMHPVSTVEIEFVTAYGTVKTLPTPIKHGRAVRP